MNEPTQLDHLLEMQLRVREYHAGVLDLRELAGILMRKLDRINSDELREFLNQEVATIETKVAMGLEGVDSLELDRDVTDSLRNISHTLSSLLLRKVD